MQRWRDGAESTTGEPVPLAAIQPYLLWRKHVTPKILQSLDLYSIYCSGQFSGMSEALDLQSVRLACEAGEIPKGRWADTIVEMRLIHSAVMKAADKGK